MSALNRDYDDVLRRALHAAAESVEPSPDGLERIRARMGSQPAFSLSLASVAAWYHEAATILVAWAAPLIRAALDTFWSVIDRFRPATAAPGEARPRYAWIRPVAAIGTAIFVVAAGALAVMTLPRALSSSPSSNISQNQGGPGSGRGGAAGGGLNNRSATPITGSASTAPGSLGLVPSATPTSSRCTSLGPSRTGSQSPLPSTLTPTTSPSSSPSSSPSPSSTSPTASPSVTPTSPTPTPTTSSPPTTTPNPGSANTPTPTTSSQPSNAGLNADTSPSAGSPRNAAIVPKLSAQVTPVIPCQTGPAKKKKTSNRPIAGGNVSAYGALRLGIGEHAGKRD